MILIHYTTGRIVNANAALTVLCLTRSRKPTNGIPAGKLHFCLDDCCKRVRRGNSSAHNRCGLRSNVTDGRNGAGRLCRLGNGRCRETECEDYLKEALRHGSWTPGCE